MNVENVIKDVYDSLDGDESGLQDIPIILSSIHNRRLRGTVAGPVGTPYEGGVFDIDITLPQCYPLEPPKMRFVTKVWHPNICSDTGTIREHNHYHYYHRQRNNQSQDKQQNENSEDTYNLKGNLLFLVGYLLSSDPESLENPLSVEAAEIFEKDRDNYNRIAKLWTDRYAKDTSWKDVVTRNSVNQIFVDAKETIEKSSSSGEINCSKEKNFCDDGDQVRTSMDVTERHQTNLKRKSCSSTPTINDKSATDTIKISLDERLTNPSPSYHWVGDGKTTTFITKSFETRTATHYPALELCNMKFNQNNPLITVRIGDNVLLRRTMRKGGSSFSSPGHHHTPPLFDVKSTPPCKGLFDESRIWDSDTAPLNEEDDTLNSTLKISSRTEASVETIDPFVGKVEDMWEEEKIECIDTKRFCYPNPICEITKLRHNASNSANSNQCSGGGLEYSYKVFDRSGRTRYLRPVEENNAKVIEQNVRRFPHIFINAMGTIPSEQERYRHVLVNDDRCKKMKMRIRWFLKKEDIASLEGKFIGVSSREHLLSTMTPQDLILLNDQTDVIDVSTILTKCLVVAPAAVYSNMTTPTNAIGMATTKGTSTQASNILSNRSPISKETLKDCGDVDHIRRKSAAFSCQYAVSIQPVRKDSVGETNIIFTSYVADSGNVVSLNGADANFFYSSFQGEDHPKKRLRIAHLNSGDKANESHDKHSIPENIPKEKATITVTSQEKKLADSTTSSSGTTTLPTSIKNEDGNDKEDPTKENNYGTDASKIYTSENILLSNDTSSKNIDNNKDRDSKISSLADEVRQALINKKQQADLPPRAKPDGTITMVGKIKVGANYQAIIPSVMKRREYAKSCSAAVSPELVWKPNTISNADLDLFISEAGKIMKKVSDEKRLQLTMMDHRLVLMGRSESDINASFTSSLFKAIEYREFNKEAILTLLHTHRYDMSAALESLSKAPPEKYLTLWTKEEQELYNAGFNTYLSSLQQISKGIHSKTHKDVIDYHYRFKIPDQFRMYQNKKLEQAKRMMKCIERRRSEEVMRRLYGSLNDSHAANAAGSSNGVKKIHEWTKTAGAEQDAIGAAEQRRMKAKDLLLLIQKEAGEKKYRMIVDYLKNFQSNFITAHQLKEGFTNELDRHPVLLKKFLSYLPIPLRNRKT